MVTAESAVFAPDLTCVVLRFMVIEEETPMFETSPYFDSEGVFHDEYGNTHSPEVQYVDGVAVIEIDGMLVPADEFETSDDFEMF